MALQVEQLIKIILGILVVVAVGVGISIFFKTQIIDFLKGISGTEPELIFLRLVK